MKLHRAAFVVLVIVLLALPAIALGSGGPAARVTSGPSCNRHAGRIAVSRSPLGDKMLQEVGDPLDPNVWAVGHFWCRHLINSHETDMVVEFLCCTADSPTPMGIFRPGANGRWHLSYSWAGEPAFYGLSLQGRTLIEKRPVFNGAPLCCPVGYHDWSVRWSGRRWKVVQIS